MKRLMRWVATMAVLAAALALFVPATAGAAKNKTTKPTGTITVSAAASLTEAFTKMGADFQKANPDTTVTFNFAASSALVAQIQGGAPADVFASADGTNMQKLVSGGQVTAEPTVFAANALTIVVKPGNPKNIKSLADLANVGTISLCADTVPCGKYAQQALTQAGVTIPADKITKGADVKATLAAGEHRRRRRRHRVHHRRQSRGQHGPGCQDPGVAQRVRDLPDRPDRLVAEPGVGEGVGAVHGVARGPEDAAELRVPPAAAAVIA